MTPKEKAEELIKWFDISHYSEKQNAYLTFSKLTLEEKKYIILKHIDEIIKNSPQEPKSYTNTMMYWQEVKQKIEKL